ncbi:MAG: hypothetical protein LBT42_00445 [Tannerella sp.]|nr:hypothetical protein [Tannerella sp.]
MKKIAYILFTAIIAFACCSDDELVKSDYDYVPNPAGKPTGVVTGDANAEVLEAKLKGTVTQSADLIDWGVVVYKSGAAELDYKVASAKASASYSFEVTATGLSEQTDYLYKAFALNKDGITYGDERTFRTNETPQFQDTYLFGVYSAVDIDITGEEDDYYYEVEIRRQGSSHNRVTIKNIWDCGKTIQATVDFAAKTITTDNKSVIYVDDTYGDCWMRGFDLVDGSAVYYNLDVNVGYAIAKYDQGVVSFEYWAARVSAGHFGFYATYLTKKSD